MLYLDENPGSTTTSLKDISASYYVIKKVAEQLAADDLVEMEATNEPGGKVIYRLSSKGKKIAKKLKEIEGILEG